MGLLDTLRKAFGGKGGAGSGRNSFGDEGWTHWVHAQCHRCGEPLRARIDLRNDPSEEEDGTWIVRKGLMGSGKHYCFQTVEVMLHFDQAKKTVLDSDALGGKLITDGEYPTLLNQWEAEQARLAQERLQENS